MTRKMPKPVLPRSKKIRIHCIRMAISTSISDAPIPSGPWSLWYHCPEESKWSLNTFTKLFTCHTWSDFMTIYETIRKSPQTLTDNSNKSDVFSDGMFFLMRDPLPPLWENSANIRGGGYSFRTVRKFAADIFYLYCLAIMGEAVSTDPNNKINGISISPKKGFNIIKIWNTNSEKFNTPYDLQQIVQEVRMDDVIYTPFHQKNM